MDQDFVVWGGPTEHSRTVQLANAEFTVRNVGGRPVRVLQTASSCGCATPTVTPALIPPGDASLITVEATPILVGEKVATITLMTDSTETPEVSLKLRILGNRRPPFLLSAAGELSFQGDNSADDTREFMVTTIEPDSEKATPIIGNSIPFLSIGAPTITTKPHSAPGVVEKRFLFQVRISGQPPVGAFRSDITVTDPWDSTRIEYVPVSIETVPSFRALPTHLILRAQADGTTLPGTFVVRSKTPIPELAIEIDGGKESPFVADEIKISEDRRTATCRLSHKRELKPSEGLHEIVVRPSRSAGESAKMSVMVRGGK